MNERINIRVTDMETFVFNWFLKKRDTYTWNHVILPALTEAYNRIPDEDKNVIKRVLASMRKRKKKKKKCNSKLTYTQIEIPFEIEVN